MNTTSTDTHQCWVCTGTDTYLKRKGIGGEGVTPEHFRITDAAYGETGDLYQCRSCGFQFCPGLQDVLAMYQQMDDPLYEDTRHERTLQAEKLLDYLQRYQPDGSLLDIGAGSGILVEAALSRGYEAIGVEPCEDLASIAIERGLPILPGVLSDQSLGRASNAVTLVDVIEHVENPSALIREAVEALSPSGVCLVISPDVNSLCARLLGKRWWHYRIAHISYFNRATLTRLLQSAGLEVVAVTRPGWYFPADYLFDRCMQYLPAFMRFRSPAFLRRITVPLNLFDSLMMVCRPQSNGDDLQD